MKNLSVRFNPSEVESRGNLCFPFCLYTKRNLVNVTHQIILLFMLIKHNENTTDERVNISAN